MKIKCFVLLFIFSSELLAFNDGKARSQVDQIYNCYKVNDKDVVNCLKPLFSASLTKIQKRRYSLFFVQHPRIEILDKCDIQNALCISVKKGILNKEGHILFNSQNKLLEIKI